MKQISKIIITLALIYFPSCSSSNTVSNNYNYRIDYFVEGGFTGMTKGVTVISNGTAKFWQKFRNVSTLKQDSIMLNESQLNSLENLLQDSTIFTCNINNSGNITTTIIIKCNNLSNKISFPGTEPPDYIPENLTEIITKIKNLYSLRKD